jgi:hypothetical protein
MAEPQEVSDLARLMFKILHAMDRGAATVRGGEAAGLYRYGWHAQPDHDRPQTEPHWCSELARRLSARDIRTRVNVAYPGLDDDLRNRCDLVVEMVDGATLWIEVKGAWKEYWRKQGKTRTYESYLLHPLVEGLDDSKTHTVPLDLDRLATLRPGDADFTAMLVIGFDTARASMDREVARLEKLAGLREYPWRFEQDVWPDPFRSSQRVKCWFWFRRVTDRAPSTAPAG